MASSSLTGGAAYGDCHGANGASLSQDRKHSERPWVSAACTTLREVFQTTCNDRTKISVEPLLYQPKGTPANIAQLVSCETHKSGTLREAYPKAVRRWFA